MPSGLRQGLHRLTETSLVREGRKAGRGIVACRAGGGCRGVAGGSRAHGKNLECSFQSRDSFVFRTVVSVSFLAPWRIVEAEL